MSRNLSHDLVDLLSAIPRRRILSAVRQHQQLLEDVDADARRLAADGPPTSYVVDFDLLYSYMWSARSPNPTAAAEIAYLFDQADGFILGPGTLLELEHWLHELVGSRLYEPLPGDGDIPLEAVGMFLADMEARLESALATPRVGEGLERLNELLRTKTFRLYSHLASIVDLAAFDRARKHLRDNRPGPERANLADALNYAAIQHLRVVGNILRPPFFPYLLTGTKVVLEIDSPDKVDDDEEGDRDYEAPPPLTRSTRSAIYECLLLSRLEPNQAAKYTVEKAFELASVTRDVKRLPSLIPHGAQDHSQEKVIRQIAAVLNDPIIEQSQELLDNLILAEGATAGSAEPRQRTTQYVMDHVVQIARRLEIGSDDVEMWSTAFVMDDYEKEADYQSVRVYSRPRQQSRDNWIFECAHYFPQGDQPDAAPFYVFRWPSRLDAPRLCRVFSQSFLAHHLDRCLVYVGTDDNQIAVDETSVPIDWHEIVEAMPTRPRWIRASSDALDLYADLWTPLDLRPLVGIFINDPDPEHVASLFHQTSSRFLFPSWARALFAKSMTWAS